MGRFWAGPNLHHFLLFLTLFSLLLLLLPLQLHLRFAADRKKGEKIFTRTDGECMLSHLSCCISIHPRAPPPPSQHLQSPVLFLLLASLLLLLPPLPLLLHLFLYLFQPLTLFLLLLLLLHGGEQLLRAFHQPLALAVDLLPGHRKGGLWRFWKRSGCCSQNEGKRWKKSFTNPLIYSQS